MTNLVKEPSNFQKVGLTATQRQLLLKPHYSIFDNYLAIMSSSFQQVGHGMILNVLVFSLANCVQVINNTLIDFFNFNAWWQPSIALGIGYLMIEMSLLIYNKFLNSINNQSTSQSLTKTFLNTAKIISIGMLGLYANSLFQLVTEFTGLSFWQYSLLVSGIALIASFAFNAVKHFYDSMQEPIKQYQPCQSTY